MNRQNNYDMITGYLTDGREAYYRLAYSYVHNKEDALDIVQESICKALSSAKTLKNPSAVKSWFYKIVVNTSLDFIRSSSRYVFLEDEEMENLASSTKENWGDMDLKSAIEHLPTKNKTVILLRYYEDLKLEEIAGILNENLNTVKTRLYSSLKKLKVELEDPDEFHASNQIERGKKKWM